MKSKTKTVSIILLITTLIGLIMKYFGIIGAGLVLAVGYSISIIIYSNYFILHPSKKLSNILLAIVIVLIPTLLFTIIQKREFSDILKGTAFWIVFSLFLQHFRGKINIYNDGSR